MVLHQIKSGANELFAAASLARSKRLRGLILLGGRFDYTQDQIAALEVPFVCCTFTNSFGSLEPGGYSSVSIDDRLEAYRAVKYLTDRGHRRIAILLNATGDRSISELRYRGYLEALEDAGIRPDPDLTEEVNDFDMAAAYEGTRRLLARGKEFTALFAIADSMGIAAMKALHDGGRRVPEDCSLIAIDGIQMSLYTIPTLTTLIQPTAPLGQQAVSALLDVLEGREDSRHIRLETTLRAGGTVAELS